MIGFIALCFLNKDLKVVIIPIFYLEKKFIFAALNGGCSSVG
jgi:hypothetical protein